MTAEMKTKGRWLLNRIFASLGGVIILCLDAVPLGVSIRFLRFSIVGRGGMENQIRFTVFACVLVALFGAIAVWTLRKIVCAWRNLAEMERLVDSMSPSERDAFLSAAKSDDVEICVDENGGRRFAPLGCG